MVSEGDEDECDARSVYDDLAFFAKIHGDPATNIRLHLPLSPVRPVRVAHDGAGGQDGIQVGHGKLSGCGMKQRADLTTLVGSRICHDLISPLGAIGNGVELLELSGMPRTPEMALIAESVENAHARIRFFRIAYGAASAEQRITRAEITSTLAAAARGGRLSYFWEPEGEQSRRAVRAVFLLLQCCETGMTHGGDIHVRLVGERWEIKAEAARLQIDEDLWTALITPRARINVDAARVQFALLPEVLVEMGRSLAIKLTPDSITARF